MSEGYPAITNWVAINYIPPTTRFKRQYPVWLHHKGASMVRAWKILLINEAAIEAGAKPDLGQIESMLLALYHVRRARLLIEDQTFEEQRVEDGDTFIVIVGTTPRPTIEDLLGFISMQKYPDQVGDEVPEGTDSFSWAELSEFRAKKMERERQSAPVITTGDYGIVIFGSNGFNGAVIGQAIGRVKSERGAERSSP